MHYIQFIAWRKFRVELLFKGVEIRLNNRFFIPEILDALNENEVFIDCGAHRGGVIERFLETIKNRYEHIYAIEPDRENFLICKSKFDSIKNITMMENALGDRNGEANFYQGFNLASRLGVEGKNIVKIITLDELDIPATFIKIHLEGGELNALKGAVNTIQKYRPIIAVTIYHNSDGAWRITHFFMNKVKAYVFCIRLHSLAGTGAVFYAVPRERWEQGTIQRRG